VRDRPCGGGFVLGGNVCGWSGAREDKEFAGRDVVEGGDGEVKILAEDGFLYTYTIQLELIVALCQLGRGW
jgi:hypothetical protein